MLMCGLFDVAAETGWITIKYNTTNVILER
jgi:hypothetical protein